MPNHVDNYLEISGKPKMINKLMKQLEITDSEATKENGATIFSCHKVIPQPIFQGEEWYEWRIANWGSKWGAYDVAVTESDWESGHWALFFSTAWSPITQVIAEMSKQHPTLRLHYRYYEGGADYWGKETYEGGELSLEEGGELSTASCEIKTEAYGDEHHWCRLCSNNYSCNGNDELCDTCLEEELKLNNELLDETGEPNDESNFVSIRDNN
jgi:Ferredoxin-like domain in Api92-like protein